ncbi:MAG TPA: hypothetical protein VMV69_00915 [Pirellulales bacterium]|nr:hypothetical protein [Pirellulales bacterium]
MTISTWIALGTVALAAVIALAVWRPIRAAMRAAEYQRARKEFRQQRERLEAKFFQIAAAGGKPRDLRWTSCDFDNDVSYARDRRSRELCSFVAVTISFEAVEGGLMEEVEAVGNLRAATAMFRWRDGRWQTDGRAIFNLNPAEAIAYYRDDLEIVGQEVAERSYGGADRR